MNSLTALKSVRNEFSDNIIYTVWNELSGIAY